MIISIHQPAYLPWPGYFHKIALSDVFVFFDTTQFEKNSFINRNKIKTSQGPIWLTVPVKLKNHLAKEIREIEIADQVWRQKHWKTIELNYGKAAYWPVYAAELKQLYDRQYHTIDQLCFDQLKLFLKWLKLEVKVVKSSELGQIRAKKQELVLEICRQLGAGLYVSGAMGKDYIEDKAFAAAGVKLYYQDYHHPVYQQLGGEFLPYLSIIDLLFNCGEQSREIIMKGNLSQQELQNYV